MAEQTAGAVAIVMEEAFGASSGVDVTRLSSWCGEEATMVEHSKLSATPCAKRTSKSAVSRRGAPEEPEQDPAFGRRRLEQASAKSS